MKKTIVALLCGLSLCCLGGCAGTAEQQNKVTENKQSVGSVAESEGETTAESDTEEAGTREVIDEWHTTMENLNVGDVVSMGVYTDPYNQESELKWDILEKNDGVALLISHDLLSNLHLPYNEEYVNTNWEQSSIRAYLNGEFYANTFTDEEKTRILLSTIDNPDATAYREAYNLNLDNPAYADESENTPCGDTQDYIFMLSIYELDKYYGPGERKENSSGYAFIRYTNGLAGNQDSLREPYLLRTTTKGKLEMYFDYVRSVGSEQCDEAYMIRPVMYVTYQAIFRGTLPGGQPGAFSMAGWREQNLEYWCQTILRTLV